MGLTTGLILYPPAKEVGMTRAWHAQGRHVVLLIGLLVAVSLSGCPIRLIAEYDETIDRSTAELQRKVETFLTRLERTAGSPAAEYSRHTGVYDEVRVDLSALKVRASAIPENRITVEQIDLLAASWSDLEQLHKIGFRDPKEIAPLRKNFNNSFTAILKLELAKRRGGTGLTK